MTDPLARLRENLAQVRQRIADAAARSGRRPEEVTLVAVTKFVPEPVVRALVEAGACLLAESRPQHLWEKAEALRELPVQWHLIGHLQRNKVRRTLPLVHMIQSADSLELIAAVDRSAGELGLQIPLLLEVNISGDEAKDGFLPQAVESALPALAAMEHVEVRGLMGMASLYGGLDVARANFAILRQLRDRLRPACPAPIRLEELSMGMSGDYEVAVEEGATMVRIGSALFEGVTT